MDKRKYDLEERTAIFSGNIINLCRNVQNSTLNHSIVEQLIRSATSIGANYCEADESLKEKCRILWLEAQELTLIFSKIAINTK